MLTKTQLATMISTNLTDDRMFSIQLYLDTLAVTRPRVVNNVTATSIPNLAGIIAAIDPLHMTIAYNFNGLPGASQTVQSFIVNLTNLEVNLTNSDLDDPYTNKVGVGKKIIQLVMGYLSDGDTVLPLKIFKVNLVDPASV